MLTRLTMMTVPWEREPLVQRREAALRGLIWPTISLTLTLVLLIVMTAWNGVSVGGAWTFLVLFFGLSVAAGAGFVAHAVLRVVRAHQELQRVGTGTAMLLDHEGVSTPQGRAPWEDVESFRTEPGGLMQGPVLVVSHRLGRDEYPIEGLGVLPAGLESGVRIFSRGSHGVDLSAVED